MKPNLLIYGAGGLGGETLDLARIIQAHQPRWSTIYFIDDNKQRSHYEDVEILTLAEYFEQGSGMTCEVVISVGEPAVRALLYQKIQAYHLPLATLIHPDVFVPQTVVVGAGCVIHQQTVLSHHVQLADNVYVYPAVVIHHDSQVLAHTFVCTHVVVCGQVQIGQETFLGTASTIREQCCVGDECIIGMGASVMASLPNQVVAVGTPAQVVRQNTTRRVFRGQH